LLEGKLQKQQSARLRYGNLHKPTTAPGTAFTGVITKGGGSSGFGAGQVALADASGNACPAILVRAGPRGIFLLGQTLEQAGGTLADIVTMPVFSSNRRPAS